MKIQHKQSSQYVVANGKSLGQRHKRQGGFVFGFDWTLVLAAAAIILVGILARNGDDDNERLVSDAVTTVSQATINLQNRMRGFDDYTGLDNSTCYDSQIFPSFWKSSTQDQFITPFSDDGLTCGSQDTATNRNGVTTTGPGKFHTFTLTGLETDQCNMFVSGVIEKFIEVDVNGTRIDSNPTLVAQCQANEENTVLLVNR